MKTQLKHDFEITFGHLYETLSSFTQSEINVIPFEGSWTAGQVTRHIRKATSGLKEICSENTQKLDGAADEKVAALQKIFLDFSTKYNSPDFIYPEDKEYDKKELIAKLQKIDAEIIDIIENYDLTLTCMNFEIPGLGHVTIYELITFCIVHTKRHIHQLEKIHKALTV